MTAVKATRPGAVYFYRVNSVKCGAPSLLSFDWRDGWDCRYAEFLIDGVPLLKHLGRPFDASSLSLSTLLFHSKGAGEFHREAFDGLTAFSDTPRFRFYICSACLKCAHIHGSIARVGDVITWSHFRFDIVNFQIPAESWRYPEVSVSFALPQYQHAIEDVREEFGRITLKDR